MIYLTLFKISVLTELVASMLAQPLISWVGSQVCGMIIIVGTSTSPFVNVVDHLQLTPL